MIDNQNGLVFWDFDGTLAFRDGGWTSCLHDILVRNGVSAVTMAQLRPHLQTGFPWHSPQLPHSQSLGGLPWWDYLNHRLTCVLVNLGLDPDNASALAAQVRDEYLRIAKWHLYGDTLDALSAVAEAGYRSCILSNHVPELRGIVDALGLGRAVGAVLSSGVLGFEKPHPRIFELALAAVGSRSPVYMVGDSLRADVLGANACGICGILVRAPNDSGYACHSRDLYGVKQFLGSPPPAL